MGVQYALLYSPAQFYHWNGLMASKPYSIKLRDSSLTKRWGNGSTQADKKSLVEKTYILLILLIFVQNAMVRNRPGKVPAGPWGE